LVVFALGLVALLLWRSRAAEDRVAATKPPAEETAQTSSELSAPEPPQTKQGVAALASPVDVNGSVSSGRVLDEAFEVPLAATVAPDVGSGTTSDGESGAFVLKAEAAGWKWLRLSAPGYVDAEVLRSAWPSGVDVECRLRPSTWTTIVIEYEDGTPAAGLEVDWRAAIDRPDRAKILDWIDSSAQVQGTRLTRVTDSMGISKLATGAPALLTVRGGARSGWFKSYLAAPGEELRVRIPNETASLIVLDARTRTPLRGVQLDLWYPCEVAAMSQRVESDADGRIPVLPNSLPILVRSPGAVVVQRELVPLGPGMTRYGAAGVEGGRLMLRLDAITESREWPIGIQSFGLQLLLLDDASGAPVDARVRVSRRNPAVCGLQPATRATACTALSPRSPFQSPDEVCRSVNGVLDVSCGVFMDSESAPSFRAQCDLVVTAEGFAPASFRFTPPASGPLEGPIEVRLHRAAARRLNVHYSDGSACREELALYAPLGDVYCLRTTSQDGIYGPFDWPGGELLLKVHGRWGPRVSPADLESSELVDVLIDEQTGSITLTGVPKTYPRSELVAKSDIGPSGICYPLTMLGADRSRFDGLPPGSYLVGPRRWVEVLELQSVRAREAAEEVTPTSIRTVVTAGQDTELSFQPSWSAGRLIEGEIKLRAPGFLRPVVMPWYSPNGSAVGDGAEPISILGLTRTRSRVKIDSTGNYRIEEHDPVPALLVVAVLDETVWGGINEMHIVEILEPGKSAEIELGSISLRWEGAALEKPIVVEYSIEEANYRHPAKSFFAKVRQWWNTKAPLTLHGVPRHVKELKLQRKPVAVEFGADGWARVTATASGLEIRAR
jgi:hypothetical protein